MSEELVIGLAEHQLATLPRGWSWSTLIDLVAPQANAMTDGPFGSKLKSSHYVETGVRVIRLGNLGIGVFKHADKSFVSKDHAATLSRHAVEANDLLIAALAEPVGRCCQVPASILPAIVKADCIRYRPHPAIDSKYVMHWLNSPAGRKNAEAQSHGVGRLRINMMEMRLLAVPVAPTREQHRIVAEIEKHFTRLDDAVATLERVQAELERARASVLKAAVEGRLVPTEAELARAEGRSYEPASVLLERVLEERRRRHEATNGKKKYKPPAEPETERLPTLPEGWVWVTVDQFSAEPLVNGRSVPTREQGFPVLRLTAMVNGRIDFAEAKGGDWTEHDATPWLVKSGDFFIMRGNGSLHRVGSAAIAGETIRPAAFPDTMIRLRPDGGLAHPRYLLATWSSPYMRAQIERSARTTAGIYKVNQGSIAMYSAALPPLAEQARIVAEVERRISVFDALEQTVRRNLARCTALRQSILKRAFSGKLVPQDPTDEPASVLLDRIRATAAPQRS